MTRFWLQCGVCWNCTEFLEPFEVAADLGVECQVCKGLRPCIAVFIQRPGDRTCYEPLGIAECYKAG